MKINVLYFAHVRDITGIPEESMYLETGSIDLLKTKIFRKYPELKKITNLLISVNNEYYSGMPLSENDTVAFFPPVSGG
ncbi:MoaD/ThiS family protein [Ferroplasma sp.]|uniref:MoaD/ThiS family protein n=1 Tax=Ferroplasma sp. TaxID=2591003 RepID=UPI00307E3975